VFEPVGGVDQLGYHRGSDDAVRWHSWHNVARGMLHAAIQVVLYGLLAGFTALGFAATLTVMPSGWLNALGFGAGFVGAQTLTCSVLVIFGIAATGSSEKSHFGYVAQLCEVTENTRAGARGFILPAAHAPGNPGENRLLPLTAEALAAAGIRLRELVTDGGFQWGPTSEAFPGLADDQIQVAHHHEPGSRRTRKRRARYRTGIEGRISHLKRGYGLRRSRLKGHEGMRIWTGWAILAYDLDTLAIRTH
jgi:Transposase DDE domain